MKAGNYKPIKTVENTMGSGATNFDNHRNNLLIKIKRGDKMKRFDKYLLWFGRIITLPLAGYCFYIAWDELHKTNGDAIVFTAFIASGTFCVAYFYVLLQVRIKESDTSEHEENDEKS